MDHPFHLHGTQFQVTERERNGSKTKAPYLAWKDTVNVAKAETVRFKVRQDMKGQRMYHCHILEHEEQRMMGVVHALPPHVLPDLRSEEHTSELPSQSKIVCRLLLL